MSHWATELIGRPWVPCGQGPDAFDCWGFFRYVQATRFDRVVPDVGETGTHLERAHLFASHQERSNWQQVERPIDGDAVLMARARYPVHIGVWITANGASGVLHCMQGAGVVYMLPPALRAAGWGRLTYYRHHPCTP